MNFNSGSQPHFLSIQSLSVDMSLRQVRWKVPHSCHPAPKTLWAFSSWPTRKWTGNGSCDTTVPVQYWLEWDERPAGNDKPYWAPRQPTVTSGTSHPHLAPQTVTSFRPASPSLLGSNMVQWMCEIRWLCRWKRRDSPALQLTPVGRCVASALSK